LIARIISCIAGLLWPRPTMSKACTMGTPAAIMVASWREKYRDVLGGDLLLAVGEDRLLLRRSLSGVMPWRRRSARAAISLSALVSPLTLAPRLSVLPIKRS
jgi:hypothetical protein